MKIRMREMLNALFAKRFLLDLDMKLVSGKGKHAYVYTGNSQQSTKQSLFCEDESHEQEICTTDVTENTTQHS